MSDQITIRVWACTNKVGSNSSVEFTADRDEWESMTPKDQEETCRDSLENIIEWGYDEVEPKH